jgi:hypothetical protein
MRQRLRSHLTYANVISTLALFLVVGGGTTLAATGGNFILGQPNSASSTTSLTRTGANTAKGLQVTNNSTGAGATALGLNVASGHAPFTVNSGTKVANLNADKLDGMHSTAFLGATAKAADSGKLDGKDSTEFFLSTGGSIFGNVSVGGTLTLANYLQLPYAISGSAPPPTDCDEGAELGRVVIRTDGPTNLYLCTGTGGWIGK